MVLNAHATLCAKGKQLSHKFQSAFNSFIYNVDISRPELPNADPNSPLGRAYYNFWKLHKEELHIPP